MSGKDYEQWLRSIEKHGFEGYNVTVVRQCPGHIKIMYGEHLVKGASRSSSDHRAVVIAKSQLRRGIRTLLERLENQKI